MDIKAYPSIKDIKHDIERFEEKAAHLTETIAEQIKMMSYDTVWEGFRQGLGCRIDFKKGRPWKIEMEIRLDEE